ncbi:hypothetical protein MMC30_000357 [Trapelia coarctata]|nr:hypothetical protein [Trapelia coarctata]
MGKEYPFACKASHLNLVSAGPPAFTSHPWLAIETVIRYMTSTFSPQELRGLERTQYIQKTGIGYFQLQSSKPQTLGYALADSPVALLAWMYEKLHDWTDEYPWTEDEILTWVSIYFFSAAGPAASVKLYYEATHSEKYKVEDPETWVANVKLGLAYFPKEVIRLPKRWGYTLGPVAHVSENDTGGHFAAWERPECITADLHAMFARNGGAYGAVKDKDGYA